MQAPKDFGLTLAYAAPKDVCRLGRGECCRSAMTTLSNMPCESDGDDATRLEQALGCKSIHFMRVCKSVMQEYERCRIGCPKATLKFTFYLGAEWFQFVFIFVHLSVSHFVYLSHMHKILDVV